MTKKLMSLLLSLLMVMAVFSVSVFADEKAQEIPFDSNGFAEVSVGNKGTSVQYSLKLDKLTFVYAEAIGGNYITIYRVLSNGSTSLTSTATSPIHIELDAGDYLIETRRPNNEVLNNYKVRVALFCVQRYVKIDGKEYYPGLDSQDMGVLIANNKSVTIGFIPEKGYSYDFAWYGSDGKKISNDNTVTVSKADSYYCTISNGVPSDCIYHNGVCSFSIYHNVLEYKDNVRFTDGDTSNYLVDKDSDLALQNKATCDCGKAGTGFMTNSNPIAQLDDLQISFHMMGIAYCSKSYTRITKENFIFVNDPSSVCDLKPGNKYDLSLESFSEMQGPYMSGDSSSIQRIFTYTPQETGEYTMSSSGNADTYLAVFDSRYECIGWDDDKSGNVWGEHLFVYPTKPVGSDRNFSFTKELKAGEKYYFAVVSLSGGNFTVNFERKSEPQSPDPIVGPSNDEMSFNDFVERLYVVALNRQSEKEGKDYWCELVGNGTLTGADCARFFLTSPEFKGRGLSDEEFLKVLYKTFFDRDAAADPDGFNFWMNSLKSVGKDTVVEGFINSPEWCNICATYGVKSGAPTAKATIASKNATAFATRLYTECLGREPEEGGLKYWSLGLTNCELSGSQAAHEFFYCQEFNDHNFDNKELITRMYKTFMGRNPDDEGLNYWLTNMNNGMTKDQVFNSFVQSQEFTEICASYAIDR